MLPATKRFASRGIKVSAIAAAVASLGRGWLAACCLPTSQRELKLERQRDGTRSGWSRVARSREQAGAIRTVAVAALKYERALAREGTWQNVAGPGGVGWQSPASRLPLYRAGGGNEVWTVSHGKCSISVLQPPPPPLSPSLNKSGIVSRLLWFICQKVTMISDQLPHRVALTAIQMVYLHLQAWQYRNTLEVFSFAYRWCFDFLQ